MFLRKAMSESLKVEIINKFMCNFLYFVINFRQNFVLFEKLKCMVKNTRQIDINFYNVRFNGSGCLKKLYYLLNN